MHRTCYHNLYSIINALVSPTFIYPAYRLGIARDFVGKQRTTQSTTAIRSVRVNNPINYSSVYLITDWEFWKIIKRAPEASASRASNGKWFGKTKRTPPLNEGAQPTRVNRWRTRQPIVISIFQICLDSRIYFDAACCCPLSWVF